MVPAAFVQERLWFLHQSLPKSGIYNIPTALKLSGPLDLDAFRAALDQLFRRHESVRTRFAMHEGRLMQLIYPPGPMPFRSVDLTQEAEGEAALNHFLRAESQHAFDLTGEAPIRATLFRLSDRRHVLLLVTHHIVSDEWSVRVMLSELKPLLANPTALPELDLQYADYAAWQNEWLDGAACRDQLSFWKDTLEGHSSPVEFPFDRPRPRDPSYAGARERLPLDGALAQSIFSLARNFKTTPFNVLFAAFQALQARYTGSDRILTGTVVNGRNRVETEPIIGFFINLLAIPTNLPDDLNFEQLIEQVKERTVAAYAHQDVPFDRVVAHLNPERSASRMPLSEVLFTIQNNILERDQWGGLAVEWVEVYNGTAKFDLNITIEQAGEQLAILAEYRTALFERETIQRLCGHYCNLLRAFAADPSQLVWKAPILDPAEQHQILQEWNNTKVRLPEPASIDGIFEAQANATPDATALKFDGGQWTYGELNHRASQLAALLVSRGAVAESNIGVFVRRGPELIQALLGILKAGGCYVPLDTEYPEGRLRYLVQDAGIQLLVTDGASFSKLPATNAKVILIDEELPHAPSNFTAVPHRSENAAYLMYTSGSTGKPKGVLVAHRNVVRLVKGAAFMSFDPGEVFLQYAPIAFDASTLEIWGPLLNGGQLAIMPPRQASLDELAAALDRFKVTTLWLTAGLFNVAVDEQIECFRGLRQMLTGGDAGSPKHFRRFLEHYPKCRLFNGYGPTENTTFTTVAEVTLDDLQESSVPIGRPISNTQVYILDRFQQPVPAGVTGELYAGGDGVARGYHNAPELTTEKFIHNPFVPGDRLYRTGDLARWRPNGVVQFLGRRDHQVKIRGFRIELGEIEEALRSLPIVREAVVIVSEPLPQQKTLVAYWTSKIESPEGRNGSRGRPEQIFDVPLARQGSLSREFRELLKERLPGHMIPSHFIHLAALPLDANGKVDRNALPAPETVKGESTDTGTARGTTCSQLEEQLLKLWRDLFRDPDIGLHDDFFDIGGQSLLATQVVSRIRQKLKIDLPLRALFDHTTISELAFFIESRRAPTAPEETTPASPAACP